MHIDVFAFDGVHSDIDLRHTGSLQSEFLSLLQIQRLHKLSQKVHIYFIWKFQNRVGSNSLIQSFLPFEEKSLKLKT